MAKPVKRVPVVKPVERVLVAKPAKKKRVKKVKKVKRRKGGHKDIVGVEILPDYQENIIVKDKGIYTYDEDDDDLYFESADDFSPRGGKIRDAIPVSKKR